ncbi:MAG: NYN domain-containing protein [Candidatus Sungbacteria bacterium]|uniref:NYN domain-containing protein n=1 Tax=Candidatus Sungiibacteriota bacterium TaxID=2750080 RepID=A0A9D6LTI4_9BACT|nr:NYN domain-containing protein [Candidatus Sungbacteria bacterium]
MSVIKHKNQRVAILFDVQNLYHSAKNLYGARVNFGAILKAATAGRQLIRAIGYVIATESGEEKGFFEALTKIGIELKVKDLQIFPGGMKKADWDVGLAVDAIRLANLVDAVVIVSGDGDYIPLLEYIRQALGVQVEVMAFGRSASARLKEMTDDFTDLGAEPEKYTIRMVRSASFRRPRREAAYQNNNEAPREHVNPNGE